MAQETTPSITPSDRAGFIERVGHLWLENPWRLATFGWELLEAILLARREERETRLSALLWNTARQFARTLTRSMLPVLVFGAVLGLAVGTIVGGFGDLVRTFIDTFALTVIYRLVLPALVVILLVARIGSAIAGRLSTFPLAYRDTVTSAKRAHPEDRRLSSGRFMTARLLLAEVVPLIGATVLTAAVAYWALAIWLMAGYMSDGQGTQLLNVLSPAGWPAFDDFIRAKSLAPELRAGTISSVILGVLIAYIPAALGTAAGQRIHEGSAEPTDYYDAVWESGAMTLIICAVAIGLTWNTF